MNPSEEKRIPVVRIAIQNSVGDKKIINFETWVDLESSASFMNAVVDKLMFIADRQIRRYELIDLHRLQKTQETEFKAMLEDLEKAEQRAQPKVVGDRRNPIEDKKARTDVLNIKQTLEQKRKFLCRLKGDIEEREKELSG